MYDHLLIKRYSLDRLNGRLIDCIFSGVSIKAREHHRENSIVASPAATKWTSNSKKYSSTFFVTTSSRGIRISSRMTRSFRICSGANCTTLSSTFRHCARTSTGCSFARRISSTRSPHMCDFFARLPTPKAAISARSRFSSSSRRRKLDILARRSASVCCFFSRFLLIG